MATSRCMKPHVAQLARAFAAPCEELLYESPPPITSVDLKELNRLLVHFFPVMVLIPRFTPKDQVAVNTISAVTSSSQLSDTTKLLEALGKAVDSLKRANAESIFAFGDVTVNFSAMEILRKGQPVVLTTKEFKTLKYLIQNTPRVISRDELLNEVWGYENYPCTRTVDNHILKLRKKLERDPSHPIHVRTIHSAGYKFLP
jgi:DNA-binding response OmpR family regulator